MPKKRYHQFRICGAPSARGIRNSVCGRCRCDRRVPYRRPHGDEPDFRDRRFRAFLAPRVLAHAARVQREMEIRNE